MDTFLIKILKYTRLYHLNNHKLEEVIEPCQQARSSELLLMYHIPWRSTMDF